MTEAEAAAGDEARARRQKAAGGGTRDGVPDRPAEVSTQWSNEDITLDRKDLHLDVDGQKNNSWLAYFPFVSQPEKLEHHPCWNPFGARPQGLFTKFDRILAIIKLETMTIDLMVSDCRPGFVDVQIKKPPIMEIKRAEIDPTLSLPTPQWRVRRALDGEMAHGGVFLTERHNGTRWVNMSETKGHGTYLEAVMHAHNVHKRQTAT